jgi:hypothetical protein
MRIAAAFAVVLASSLAAPALGEELQVDPEAGNNTFTAVFDAKLGERITAQSSSVGCRVAYDEKAGTASGTCSVPLTSIKVDNEETKTEHFQQWATNKKSEPKDCRFEVKFEGVKLGALSAENAVLFSADLPFTICGRGPVDHRKEHVKGTAVLFPAGSYGPAKTIRVRATVENFDRDAYHVGPKYTDGWLAKVQTLAKVVAEKGTVELTLFAKPAAAAAAP